MLVLSLTMLSGLGAQDRISATSIEDDAVPAKHHWYSSGHFWLHFLAGAGTAVIFGYVLDRDHRKPLAKVMPVCVDTPTKECDK